MISVCIATYNGEKYIYEQICSIIHQLSDSDEIIISDDNSTDSTLKIITSFNDKRIKIYHHTKNLHEQNYAKSHYMVTANFQNSLKYALGDYIFIADQDDIWEPDKVKTIINELHYNALVMTNCSLIDQDNNVLSYKYFKENPIKKNLYINILTMPFHGCCMAFRKELLEIVLPFPNNIIMHDNWIGNLALITNQKILFIDKPSIKYRRHSWNVSSTRGKSYNPLWFKFLYRIEFLFLLIKYNHKYKSKKLSEK